MNNLNVSIQAAILPNKDQSLIPSIEDVTNQMESWIQDLETENEDHLPFLTDYFDFHSLHYIQYDLACIWEMHFLPNQVLKETLENPKPWDNLETTLDGIREELELFWDINHVDTLLNIHHIPETNSLHITLISSI